MTPFMLTSVIQSSSLSLSSVTGTNDVAPALANTSSMVPSAALASAFICSIDERSQTSHWMAIGRAACVVDLVGDLAGGVGQDVRDGDGGALARQLLGQAHADAAAAARDHGRLAGDLRHDPPSAGVSADMCVPRIVKVRWANFQPLGVRRSSSLNWPTTSITPA